MADRTHQYPDPENPNQQGWWLQTVDGPPSPVAQAPPPPPPPTPALAPAITYGIDPQILRPRITLNLPPPPPPPPANPPIAPLPAAAPPAAAPPAAALPAAGAANPRAGSHTYSPQEIRAMAVLRLGVAPGVLNWEATAAAVLAVCPVLRGLYGTTAQELARAAHNFSDRWSKKLKFDAEAARVQAGDASLRVEMRRVLAAANVQQGQLSAIGRLF